MIKIKKINIISFSLLIAIFEFWNLLFLALFNFSNSFVLGFCVGFLGALFAIIKFNISGLKVKLHSNKKVIKLEKIDFIIPSIANGFFLGILFSSQNLLVFLPNNFFGLALLGFGSVLITLLICFAIYNFVLSKTRFKVGAMFNSKHKYIKNVSLLRFSIYAALFEFFIMPLMGLFFVVFGFLPVFVSFPLAGFLAGFIGSILGCFIFNKLGEKFPLQLELSV